MVFGIRGWSVMIEKEKFVNYTVGEKKSKDIFTVRLGDDFSRESLELGKKILEQERDSTAIKQLATIGLANVIHDAKTKALLAIVFKNKRNNKRQGIVTYDPLNEQM